MAVGEKTKLQRKRGKHDCMTGAVQLEHNHTRNKHTSRFPTPLLYI